jgi:hypothetical protein
MNDNNRDRDNSNYRFLGEVLQNSGVDGLKLWYLDQPEDRKAYVRELLGNLSNEINDLRTAEILKFPPKFTVIPGKKG